MAYLGIMLEVDASELQDKIKQLQDNMQEKQFENAMYGIFKRTSRHVSMILKKDLPQQYVVKSGDIAAAVKNPSITVGGGGVGCVIPIRGTRGSIGGRYKASGSWPGWHPRKYKVKAKILKGASSTLPSHAGSYGGNPPFRNSKAARLNGIAFTRRGKDRGPILKMSGIAIPQMPTNRSEPDVQNDIKNYLEKQIDARIRALILNGR